MSNDKEPPSVDSPPSEEESQSELTESDSVEELTTATEPDQTQAGEDRGGRALPIAALVLSLLAIGLSAYLWYSVEVQQKLEQTRSTADINVNIKGLGQQVAGLEKLQNRLESRQGEIESRQGGIEKTIRQIVQENIDPLKVSQATLQKSQAKLGSSMESLSTAVEKVYTDLDRSLDSWALEEIEQLLRIANHSLSLSQDVNTARAGLELADRRLHQLGNPKFTEVRRLIADELVQLQGIGQPDVAGLALRLSSITSSVDKLPLAVKPQRGFAGEAASSNTVKPASTSDKLYQAGQELLADLKDLVRVQNVSEPAKPLLSPDQRFYLFENLRLLLTGAQIALLKADTGTFRNNLSQAESWLRNYFDTEDGGVAKIMTDLEEIGQVDLKPELPDISTSLNALQKIKQRASTG